MQLLQIIMAFQHFAGKSMKVTDVETFLDPDDLAACERVLRQTADWCAQQSDDWPDLHQLAKQITNIMDRRI